MKPSFDAVRPVWRNMVALLATALATWLIAAGTLNAQAPRAPEPEDAAWSPATAPHAKAAAKSNVADKLAKEQQTLAEEFARLEQKLRRAAQLSSATDPARAALLKQAFTESKTRLVASQLEEIARRLAEPAPGETSPAYDKVLDQQTKAQADLKALVEMLQNESRAKQQASEAKLLREFAQRLGRLIRSQEEIASRTESGDDAKQLSKEQKDLTDRAGTLRDDVVRHDQEKRGESGEATNESGGADGKKPEKKSPPGEKTPGEKQPDGKSPDGKSLDGKSSDGKSAGEGDASAEPGNPVEERLRQAQKKMREAQKKLDEAKRAEATKEQQEAVEQLKAAQAEIEKILRQMREEQVERTLEALEQRFRSMLEAEIAIYDETKQLDKTPVAERTADNDIKAGRLGRRQQEVVLICERAIALLRDDGSAAALPEAAEQVRDDMRRVAELLAASRTDTLTQQIEQDAIAALDEIVAAVKQAQADAKAGKPARQPQQGGGEPGDSPLVDALAELKMLRTMQVNVNRRLKQTSGQVQGDQATDADVRRALDELSQRQKRIVRITRDIVTGKTE